MAGRNSREEKSQAAAGDWYWGERLALQPRQIALVSRDRRQKGVRGSRRFSRRLGFAPFLGEVLTECSRRGSDTVFFCPWTHHEAKDGALKWRDVFPARTSHSAVILEAIRPRRGQPGYGVTQVWSREVKQPVELTQHFGMSSASAKIKRAFVETFEARQFGSALVMICGETNIVRTKRDISGIVDDFGVRRRLRALAVEVILNPVHTYMRRHEMVEKRKALASGGRWLVSVWNAGMSSSETERPWAAYHSGQDVSRRIAKVEDPPIPDRPGIRIGILEIR